MQTVINKFNNGDICFLTFTRQIYKKKSILRLTCYFHSFSFLFDFILINWKLWVNLVLKAMDIPVHWFDELVRCVFNVLCYYLYTMFIVDLEILGYALLCFFPFFVLFIVHVLFGWFFIIIFLCLYYLSVLLVIYLLSSFAV